MKKKLAPLMFLCLSTAMVKAQMIENPGMETWVDIPGVLELEHPTYWSGSDKLIEDNASLFSLLGLSPQKQMWRSTDAHSGTYATLIESKDLSPTLGSFPALLVNATISINPEDFSGGLELSGIFDKLKFSNGTATHGHKVDKVSAWIKLPETNTDRSSVVITAYQNGVTATGIDTVFRIGQSAFAFDPLLMNGYTKVDLPLTYFNNAITATDTLIVAFSSSAISGNSPVITAGNQLLVDDVTMTLSDGSTTAIHMATPLSKKASIYPNPATDKVYVRINNDGTAPHQLRIFDALGRTMYSTMIKSVLHEIDITSWHSGIYYYTLHNEQNGEYDAGQLLK